MKTQTKPILYNINAIITIAYRDFIKFARDYRRVIISLIFPFIFVVILGQSFGAFISAEGEPSLNYMAFIATGILGQTLFQSTASGLISLVQDREEDFAQELFIAPVPRYIILLGKIIGEASVAAAQGIGVLAMSYLIGVRFTPEQWIGLIPVFIVATMLGGAFGILVLSNLNGPRAANQIFPLLLLPQFFLSGAFNPIVPEAPLIYALSRITPMTYAIDFGRQVLYPNGEGLYYTDAIQPVGSLPVVSLVIVIMFVVFLGIGTFIFVRNERNR